MGDRTHVPSEREALGNLSLAMDEWMFHTATLRKLLKVINGIDDEHTRLVASVLTAYVVGLVRRMGYAHMGTAEFAAFANRDVAVHIQRDTGRVHAQAHAAAEAYGEGGGDLKATIEALHQLIGMELEMVERDCDHLRDSYDDALDRAANRRSPVPREDG